MSNSEKVDVTTFMSSYINVLQQNVDLDIFLIPGYYKYNSGYIFVTEVGMKHLISGLLCYLRSINPGCNKLIDPIFCHFITTFHNIYFDYKVSNGHIKKTINMVDKQRRH